jgi:hypothetical protein
MSNLLTGKSFALCKWFLQNNAVEYGEFMVIAKQERNVSQLRQDILESIEEYLWDNNTIPKGVRIDQEKPVKYLELNPEQELQLLIFIEKTWGIRFEEQAAQEFAKNTEVGTIADLITIIIKIMNGTD